MADMRDVPHVEIRKTDVRQCSDVSVDGPDGLAAALKLLREILQGREQESFVILILDGQLRVSHWREVARGAVDHVEVPVRETFRTALLCDARALILAHNHPSGDPTPSEPDKILTAALQKAGAYINCPILDHMIIGGEGRYYSFAAGAMNDQPLALDGPRQPPEFDDD